jgi:2-oxoglutarate dehydrogenase E2 component (dihydrolipoamide succinyltransferase)
MPSEVFMPQMGESVVEGTITRWLKTKGEQIEEYEALLEVNTDKVDTEIPSPISGVLLEILVPEGTTVQAGTLLGWIGEPGEAIPSKTEQIDEPVQVEAIPASTAAAVTVPPPLVEAGRERDLGFISPVVARIASEHRVDLSRVPGTGQAGRITKKDILAYIEMRETGSLVAPIKEAPASAASAAVSPPPAPPTSPVVVGQAGNLLPLTPVRRAIADHMVLSRRTSPHVTTVMEVDLSRVVAHRQANKADFARDGVNLTFTAYFASASATALRAYPIVNSSWTEEGIRLHQQINIGMATSLGEDGLIVPVIKGADSLSLLGLARAINDLANRARLKKLQPDEVKGGTFTITNHGTSGSLFAMPIINQPQCAILGIGAIQKRVVVISDESQGDSIAIRPMVYLSLTFDHRILDGALADYFLGKVVESLKNWG